MDKYRIIEEIDNSAAARETRAHIVWEPTIRYKVQRYEPGIFFNGSYHTRLTTKTIKEAIDFIEKEIGKNITTIIHEVKIG